MNIAPKITVKKDYILVEHKEVDFGEIWKHIEKLRDFHEFSEKNDIWVFHENSLKLDYDDLHNLKEFLKEVYPKNVTKSKTALVVTPGLESVMALLCSQTAGDFPFEIKVFTDFQAAENWITNK
jgi:hypothetical protein